MSTFTGAAEPLTRQGFRDVVGDLGVGTPELLAVLAVESRGCGFLPNRAPKILFERHWFHKFTRGVHSDAHPGISNKVPGGYLGGAAEYARLNEALALDRVAALKSASWGAGQIMGFNFADDGHADVEAFVTAMMASEDQQLSAVAAYLRANDLVSALQTHDWPRVARAYNGSDFAKNKYDQRLAGAHAQYASGTLPDVDVRRAQLYLSYLGIDAGGIDGVHGKRSRDAVAAYRAKKGLGTGDRVDKGLLAALSADVAGL